MTLYRHYACCMKQEIGLLRQVGNVYAKTTRALLSLAEDLLDSKVEDQEGKEQHKNNGSDTEKHEPNKR